MPYGFLKKAVLPVCKRDGVRQREWAHAFSPYSLIFHHCVGGKLREVAAKYKLKIVGLSVIGKR